MKNIFLVFISIVVMLSTSIVFADAIAPELPGISTHNYNTNANPFIYVIVTVAIVIIACIIGIKNNNKGTNRAKDYNDIEGDK